jgi:ketosteroid isomerase-like protein
MRPVHVLPILLAAVLGCPPAPPKDTSAEAKTAIDAANATWASLTSSGHADSLASYYHANAVLLPPNMAPVHGKEAIRGFFAQMNTMAATLAIHADSVWASGPAAVELGRWNFVWPASAKRPPGFPAADSGKYIVRWVNENGRWLMMQDIWNSDVPLPMAPPPAPTPKKS